LYRGGADDVSADRIDVNKTANVAQTALRFKEYTEYTEYTAPGSAWLR
jgi:hypothetical protein